MKPLLIVLCAVAALGTLTWAQNATKKTPPASKDSLPPAGKYADYAFSKDAKSFDPEDPIYARLGTIPPGVTAVGKGYVELGCGSSQVVLKMPMGWLGSEDGRNSTLFTPDQSTRIIMGFRDMGEKISFAAFKTKALNQTRAQMKALKQPEVVVRSFELPGGSYAVEATGITTGSGAKNGFMQVFTPNPNPKNARFVMSLSLTSPASSEARAETPAFKLGRKPVKLRGTDALPVRFYFCEP